MWGWLCNQLTIIHSQWNLRQSPARRGDINNREIPLGNSPFPGSRTQNKIQTSWWREGSVSLKQHVLTHKQASGATWVVKVFLITSTIVRQSQMNMEIVEARFPFKCYQIPAQGGFQSIVAVTAAVPWPPVEWVFKQIWGTSQWK